MSKPSTNPQPAVIDAVAGALGVEISDADRTAYQLERAASDPVADLPKPDDKPAGTPPPGDGAAPNAGAEGTPPGDGGTPPGDGATPPGDGKGKDGQPAEPTAEEIAAILDGKPLTPKGPDGKELPPEPGKTGDALLDDEIPAEVNGRTRERMEKLLTRGRESHAKIQELSSQVEELAPLAEQAEGWQAVVVKSGLTPEDFATVMGTMAYLNNGSLAEKRVAFGRIEKMYRDLATELGEGVDGVDPLEGFADLKGMVDRQELPMAQAVELAQGRRRRKAEEDARSGDDQVTQLRNARTQAEARLDVVGQQLAQRDGNTVFMIRKHIALKALQGQVASLHPSKWEGAFLDAYDATPKAVVDATIAQLRGSTAQRRTTPIMGNGSGGGGAPGGTGGGTGGNGGQPVRKLETTEDAVFAALGIPKP